jgi:hypothetical protein
LKNWFKNYKLIEIQNFMKSFLYAFLILVMLAIVFRLTCGIFVIQPIGAIPEGKTMIYWKVGMPNMPFIASADGILEEQGQGVSLLGRGLVLAGLVKPLKEKEIISFGYSESLYLISTGGKEYGN